jgi:peptidylprolyl isomerase
VERRESIAPAHGGNRNWRQRTHAMPGAREADNELGADDGGASGVRRQRPRVEDVQCVVRQTATSGMDAEIISFMLVRAVCPFQGLPRKAVSVTVPAFTEREHMRNIILLPLLAAWLSTAGWAQTGTMPAGLQITDQKAGTGAEAKKGQVVEFHYTGWLLDDGRRGKKFDSSVDRFRPLKVSLGAGLVIKGLDEGIQGMKAGGRREIVIPPELGYGVRGADRAVPSNATLIYEVELLSVS